MGSFLAKVFCGGCAPCRKGKHNKDPSTTFDGLIPNGNGNQNQTVGISGNSAFGDEFEPKKYSWDTRPKLNPEDYTISNLSSEQRVKRPGEINGQQLIIKDCNNSKIYLMDHSSTVTIDDCCDCLFVVGPVQGSVFLRDTKNSTLVCASSQLRLRDCQNINLFVGCESDPIIEASLQILVAPYFLSYIGIEGHFKEAKLSKFKTIHWAEIYDFTPPINDSNLNWTRYNRDKHLPERYICLPEPQNLYSDLRISFNEDRSFLPVTYRDTRKIAYPGDGEEEEGHDKIRHEVTFSLGSGQDLNVLEELMDKFYKEKFLRNNSDGNELALNWGNGEVVGSGGGGGNEKAKLINIECKRNQFTFIYYSDT